MRRNIGSQVANWIAGLHIIYKLDKTETLMDIFDNIAKLFKINNHNASITCGKILDAQQN